MFVPVLRYADGAATYGGDVVGVGGADVVELREAVGCGDGDEVRLGGPAGLEGDDVGVGELLVEPWFGARGGESV